MFLSSVLCVHDRQADLMLVVIITLMVYFIQLTVCTQVFNEVHISILDGHTATRS
jgi:hypothetical protein